MSGFGFVVRINNGLGSDSYVCTTYLTTGQSPAIQWCRHDNDAHQFEHAAAAEAIAFLVGGEVYRYGP